MIQSNEVRLGNKVQDFQGKIYTIEVCDFQNDTFDVFYPVPLTIDLLGKIGFKADEDAGNWAAPEHTIYSYMGLSVGVRGEYIGWYNRSEDDFFSSYYPELKYLHQLQNLYFIMNGKEINTTGLPG